MNVTIREHAGRIALDTPVGTLVLDGVTASRMSTALEQCARWSVSKASSDRRRALVVRFPLYEIIDPAPITEQGRVAPPDRKGQSAVEPEPVSSGGGINAGSDGGGGGE